MSRARREAVAFAVIVLAAAAYSARRVRLDGDIAHFLPDDGDPRQAAISRALASSPLSRTLLLVVQGGEPATVRAAARALAASLRERRDVEWVRGGVDEASRRAFAQTYSPRRLAFLDDGDDDALRARLSAAGLRAAARALRRRLAGPAGALVARGAAEDPLGAFDALLSRAQSLSGAGLRSVEGQLVTPDGGSAVLFVATRASAFDAARQRSFLAGLDGAFARVRAAHGASLRLLRAGAHPVTVAAEAQTRGDAERISAAGSLGVAALFLALHRSPRYLLLASLPVAAGTALALAACLLAFGAVHGLTLAFGASLIGVTFDYPVYLINHHTLRPAPEGTSGTLARVWPGLRMGAFTTVGGLVGMGLTSFPGLRELALFAAVGVLGALLATRFLVTPLLPSRPHPVALQRRLAEALARLVSRAGRGRARHVALVAALALCAAGLPRVRWDDEVRALTRVAPGLEAEARAASSALGGGEEAGVVLAMGDDDEEALQRNVIVARAVRSLADRGALQGARSVHGALWPLALQARNERALRADPALLSSLDAAFSAEGFRPGAFGAFARALRAPAPPPLTFARLAATPLGDMARVHRVEVGRRVAYLTFLRGPDAARRVSDALRGVADVVVFDQRAFLRGAHARYRERTVAVLAAGLALVFALLLARYRDARTAAAAMAPAVLACGGALSALGLLGVRANLMHLVGVILVLSVGVDYGIFMAETARHPEASRETILSVAVAWCTSVLSFGLLTLSSAVPLRAIGLVTGVGVTLSLLLAPIAIPSVDEGRAA